MLIRHCMGAVALIVLNYYSRAAGESLSLDAAVAEGVRRNPELKAASARIKASEGRFWSTVSPPPAEISITNDYVPAGQNLGSWGEKTSGISQSIEFPSNYVLRASKNNREAEILRYEYQQAELGVISRIKTAYFRVLALQAQLNLARENLELADRFAKKAQIRYSAGEGTGLEDLTARAQYTQALNSVDVNANHVVNALAELKFAMGYGREDQTDFKLTDTFSIPVIEVIYDSIADVAAKSHPGLAIGRLRREVFSKEKSLAWSGLLPGLNFGLFSKSVRSDGMKYYGASAGLSVPIWWYLDQHGKIKEAGANLAASEYELLAERNAVNLAVGAAFNEFNNARKQLDSYRNSMLPQAEEIYRVALKSYEAGEITYVEYLQTQQTAITVRSGYVDALLEYNLSIVALGEAVGKQIPLKGEL